MLNFTWEAFRFWESESVKLKEGSCRHNYFIYTCHSNCLADAFVGNHHCWREIYPRAVIILIISLDGDRWARNFLMLDRSLNHVKSIEGHVSYVFKISQRLLDSQGIHNYFWFTISFVLFIRSYLQFS